MKEVKREYNLCDVVRRGDGSIGMVAEREGVQCIVWLAPNKPATAGRVSATVPRTALGSLRGAVLCNMKDVIGEVFNGTRFTSRT